MLHLFLKPLYLMGFFLVLGVYLAGLRFFPKRKISEERALEALGLRELTILKTFLKDSTIWL